MEHSENEGREKQNYELAFHLVPTLEELGVLEKKETLEKLITEGDGVVTFSKLPEKTRLSYPIRRERGSFFGYIHFNLSTPETLEKLTEHIRLDNSFMRHIILKLETDAQKEKALARAAQHKERREQHKAQKPTKEALGETETKEMEKRLEEIIGGL